MLGKRVKFKSGDGYIYGHTIASHKGEHAIIFVCPVGSHYDVVMDVFKSNWKYEIDSGSIAFSDVNVDKSLKYRRIWKPEESIQLAIENIE